MSSPTLTTAFQLALRAALSAGLALAIAQLLQLQYPIYAMIGAVIVTDLSPLQTRQLALQRLAGTVLGAAIGAAIIAMLGRFGPPGPVTIGSGILAAMFLSPVLRLHGAAKVTGYVCGIVLLDHHGHPLSYALNRVIETVIGIGLAWLVSLVPKLIPADAVKKKDS
jgi:uncharacterized membrane protein YgaE (UPF0421/DUF939 family)